MPREIACPTCKKPTSYEGNPHRPFCNERCQKLDLGTWAVGGYTIPGKALEVEEETISPKNDDTEEPSPS